MNTKSRFKFTDRLFFDGIAWNYLKYDGFKDCIEGHIILDHRTSLESYVAFMNIVHKNIEVEIKDDILYLSYDRGNCIVTFRFVEKTRFFFKKKYIEANFKFLPRNLEYVSKTKLKHRIDLTGNEKWDMIANFMNRIIE